MIKIEENIKISGDILVRIKNKNTGEEKKIILHNQITNNYLDEIIKPIYAGTPDCETKFLAFGTDNSTPSASNPTLGTETYRIADTSLGRSDTGQVTSEYVLDGADYVAEVPAGTIEEIGFFAGSSAAAWGAGAGKDTGLLVSRLLFDYDITADEEIYFQRIETYSA
ncbi:MAG: hypothetical protein ACFFDH_00410 [Promethearchaeota archaeon]